MVAVAVSVVFPPVLFVLVFVPMATAAFVVMVRAVVAAVAVLGYAFSVAFQCVSAQSLSAGQ